MSVLVMVEWCVDGLYVGWFRLYVVYVVMLV